MSTTNSAEEPKVDPAKLVFWVDVLLLAALGLATLLAAPQRLRRFATHGGEWKRGHVLYHTSTKDPVSRSSSASNSTLLNHKPSRMRRWFNAVAAYPASSPSPAFKHKLIHFLRTPVIPGYSLGRIILMLLYFGVLLFAALFRDSVFTNPVRDAWIAISQLPFVYALAMKNSPFTVLLGLGYEKLNYLHRYAGRLIVLAANVHAIGFIYKWTLQGVWTERLQEAEFRWGVVALVSFDILFFFSLRLFRQLSYNLFFVTHLIGLSVVIVAISFHQPAARPYTIIAAGLYIGDRILRLLKSRITSAHIECIPELGTTLVRIPAVNTGWRAGQHVRIRFLSLKMGVLQWTESHPYTIAGAAVGSGSHDGGDGVSGEEGLTLLVKKTGDWSRRLYIIAETGEYDSWPDKGTSVRVHVDGPYGGPGNTVLSSFSGAVFLVGGSGITFALTAVREILQHAAERAARHPDGESGTGTVEIVWTVQHARAITPLLPVFTALLRASGSASEGSGPPSSRSSASSSSHKKNKPTLKITVYYTRAITYLDAQALRLKEGSKAFGARNWIGSPPMSPNVYTNNMDDRTAVRRERHRSSRMVNTGDDGEARHTAFPPGLSVHASRPHLPYILNNFMDRTIDVLPGRHFGDESKNAVLGSGVLIGVCGPTSLADDARLAVGGLDEAKRKAVGGIEVVEEAFHW